MCSIPVHMIRQSPCAVFALPFQSIIIFYYFYSRNCQLDVGAPLDLLPKLSPSNQYQLHIICPFSRNKQPFDKTLVLFVDGADRFDTRQGS